MLRTATILVLYGVFGYFPLLAQNASVSGLVTDPSGRAVVKAVVSLTCAETGQLREVESNGDGIYNVVALAPGHYHAAVQAPGFRATERRGFLLEVAQTARLDFQLQVGEMRQTVTVQGGSEHLQTTDGAASLAVGGQLTANLPLNGRSFEQLITLTPGVELSPSSATAGQFTVNGQRSTANAVSIDGASANVGFVSASAAGGSSFAPNAAGGTSGLVSVDAIREFRVLTSSYAPEFGRTPGGQILIRSRSGTNGFHGAAFNYFRNDVLDANDWFANSTGEDRSALRFNDFGGVFGGPLRHNRTFFFLSYEGQQLLQPAFTLTTVPSAASRAAAAAGAAPLLNAFPQPNGPALTAGYARLAYGSSSPVTTNAGSVRLDHNFRPTLNLFARYSHSPSEASSRSPSYINRKAYRTQTLTAGLTWVAGPRLVSETTLNFSSSWNRTRYVQDSFMGSVPVSESLEFPAWLSADTAVFTATLQDGGSINNGLGRVYEQRQVQCMHNWTLEAGTHQLKAGADFRFLLPYTPLYDNVQYIFTTLSNALLNKTSYFQNQYQAGTRGELKNFSAYLQDAWRATRRLSLTYGARWEVNTPPRSRRPNNGGYLPVTGDFSNLTSVQIGVYGSPLWNTQYGNIAPRLGAAYQARLQPGWETVLRVGGGLFYDLGAGHAVLGPWMTGYPNYRSAKISGAAFPVASSSAAIPEVNLTNPPASSTFYAYPENLALPRTWQWNLAVQQALGTNQSITLSYVGSQGGRLLYQQRYLNVGTSTYTVNYTGNKGVSSYHSFQLQFRRQMLRGLAATAAYTWGHAIDNLSNDYSQSIPGSRMSVDTNYGSADFDIRHSFKLGFSADLPGGRGPEWLRAIRQGWGLDGIVVARSSMPLDLTYSQNIGYGSYSFRPDLIAGAPVYLDDPNSGGGWRINSAAFTKVATRQGTLGRNALHGFPMAQADLSLRRRFRLSERLSFLFRADAFNILNHPNFGSPNGTVGSATFGVSTGMLNGNVGGGGSLRSLFQVGGPRSLQLSAKLTF